MSKCGRCLDWSRLGLSSTCPSCDLANNFECSACGLTFEENERDEYEPSMCRCCACPHGDRDHGICLDCGDEEDPGAAIDRAMDAFEDR